MHQVSYLVNILKSEARNWYPCEDVQIGKDKKLGENATVLKGKLLNVFIN